MGMAFSVTSTRKLPVVFLLQRMKLFQRLYRFVSHRGGHLDD